MKLKRYTGKGIREAMNKVRQELGSDAVILSNRKTADGVEIIAATDYDDAIVNSSHVEQKKQTEDLIPLKNNKKLAEHLSKKFDLESSVEKTNKNISDAYGVSDDPLGNDSNKSQVSNEWIHQLKSKMDESLDTGVDRKPQRSETVSDHKNTELEQVKEELNSIRGLLETQLSSLAWNDANKRFPNKTKTLKHLLELGITTKLACELLSEIDNDEAFESCWRKSLALFAGQIPVEETPVLEEGGVFALVGPTGVGKTTTIAKLAARYALKHGTDNIALITTDNYRIGAQEQLRTYGRILGAPVKVANDSSELKKTLKSLYDKDLVLIDTAGMSQRDMRLTEQFSMLGDGASHIKTYLVLSSSSQQTVLDEIVQAYKKAYLDGCIITKLDESISMGGVLSTLAQHHLPIAFVSDGQRVPEDLHQIQPVELVKKAVIMMNDAQIRMDDQEFELAFGGMNANDIA